MSQTFERSTRSPNQTNTERLCSVDDKIPTINRFKLTTNFMAIIVFATSLQVLMATPCCCQFLSFFYTDTSFHPSFKNMCNDTLVIFPRRQIKLCISGYRPSGPACTFHNATAHLTGFSHTTISGVLAENGLKMKARKKQYAGVP